MLWNNYDEEDSFWGKNYDEDSSPLRGGSWAHYLNVCRSENRADCKANCYLESMGSSIICGLVGFRIVES